jgi:uroporphyrinogen-III synthase
VAGRSVLIVCGAGGRRLLAEELGRRGAKVVEHVCYRRVPVAATPGDPCTIDAILVSSGDGFEAVARLWFEAGGRPEVPVLVPSRRVAELGARLGFGRVVECAGASGRAYLDGLQMLEPHA